MLRHTETLSALARAVSTHHVSHAGAKRTLVIVGESALALQLVHRIPDTVAIAIETPDERAGCATLYPDEAIRKTLDRAIARIGGQHTAGISRPEYLLPGELKVKAQGHYAPSEAQAHLRAKPTGLWGVPCAKETVAQAVERRLGDLARASNSVERTDTAFDLAAAARDAPEAFAEGLNATDADTLGHAHRALAEPEPLSPVRLAALRGLAPKDITPSETQALAARASDAMASMTLTRITARYGHDGTLSIIGRSRLTGSKTLASGLREPLAIRQALEKVGVSTRSREGHEMMQTHTATLAAAARGAYAPARQVKTVDWQHPDQVRTHGQRHTPQTGQSTPGAEPRNASSRLAPMRRVAAQCLRRALTQGQRAVRGIEASLAADQAIARSAAARRTHERTRTQTPSLGR